MPDVTLTVSLPDGTELHLGPFTPAGSDLGFHARFTVPAGTPAGPAEVRDADRPDDTWGPYAFSVGAPS